MANINQNAKQPEKSDQNPHLRKPLGHGHEDVTDDFNALLSVFGISGFSSKLKQKAIRMVRR